MATTDSGTYGLLVEQETARGEFGRGYFKVTRYGRRYYARTFVTRRLADTWLKKAEADCRSDPLSGLHFAPDEVKRIARRAAGAS